MSMSGCLYCNYLLTQLWRHNFEINLLFLNKPFFLHDRKSRKKLKYFDNKKSFQDGRKSVLRHFQRASTEVNKNYFFSEGESSTLRAVLCGLYH